MSRPAVERAALPSGTTSHDLRHHHASVLLVSGESVVAASLVLSTYGHLMPDSEERTRRAIDEAWAPLRAMNVPSEQPASR